MSTTPDTTVVVVEERRRRFPVPLVATVAGAVLLGASTFALWTAYGDLTGGTIAAGDLDLTLTSAPAFYDVSGDRADKGTVSIATGSTVKGHTVDPAQWRIVPGDKVAMVYDAQVTLEGDNMVASLSVTEKAGGDLNITGMDYSYEIYKGGSLLVTETDLGDDDALLYLAAPETPGAVGPGIDAEAVTPVYVLDSSGTEDFTVVVYGTFDAAVVDTLDSAQAYDTLTGLAITLTQVRDAGAVFNP